VVERDDFVVSFVYVDELEPSCCYYLFFLSCVDFCW